MNRAKNYLQGVIRSKQTFIDEKKYINDIGVHRAIIAVARQLNNGVPYTSAELEIKKASLPEFSSLIDSVYQKLSEAGIKLRPDANMIFEILEKFQTVDPSMTELIIRFRTAYAGYVESAPTVEQKIDRDFEMRNHQFAFQVLTGNPTITNADLKKEVDNQGPASMWRIRRYWLSADAKNISSATSAPVIRARPETLTEEEKKSGEVGAAHEYLENARRVQANMLKPPTDDIIEDPNFRRIFEAVVPAPPEPTPDPSFGSAETKKQTE
jgi:hypothetical protein